MHPPTKAAISAIATGCVCHTLAIKLTKTIIMLTKPQMIIAPWAPVAARNRQWALYTAR